jgi:alkaline phosphatase D
MKLSARSLWKSTDRRTWLQGVAAAAAALSIAKPRSLKAIAPTFTEYPFRMGVASGDPTPDGFVLWTRLLTDPFQTNALAPEDFEVRYEVARDDGFTDIVAQGTSLAEAQFGHSVHIEVDGLKPQHKYFYRFHVADATSPVGQASTLPAYDQVIDKFRFAFASCQHYEQGLYHAYADMVQQNVDLFVHLGDYIYEQPGTLLYVRRVPGGETLTLDDYRRRYAVYRSDPLLQAAHAACPWLVTWDDHEFDNNCAADISEELNVTPEAFLIRRAFAYQAYYENMPLRAAQRPEGPNLKLYRTLQIGNLATFHVLDTRQYRSDQPCGDGTRPPCDEVLNPEATVLGQAQEQWLSDNLKSSKSQWNVLAQQIMMGRVDRDWTEGVAWSMDQWSAYDVPRRRLMKFMSDNKIANPVVLTGDIHTNWVNELRAEPNDINTPPVAAEFVGTSLSSGGQGIDQRADAPGVYRDNPFVKFYNGERGYVSCEINSNEWISDYRVVESVMAPMSKVFSRAKFRVEAGRSNIERV